MLRLYALCAILVMFASQSWAQSLSEKDRAAFQSVISGQIDAFRSGDGARAYDFAAPSIKRIFPSVDSFMTMVQRGYQPVYRPRAFNFGEAGISASGRPTQRLMVIGPDGLSYEALYTMEQQPDGSWEISGCTILRTPEAGA
jgi:hypothetical protein